MPMPSQPSRQRTELPFSRNEWDLLVKLPGRVVVAATAADRDAARHTVSEGLAGIDAIAAGRGSASHLVRDVVAAIYAESDEDVAPVDEFHQPDGGIAEVLADCHTAARILAERAGIEDADGYRHWLESIAARVCHTARTAGRLGVGSPLLTPSERRFLIELGAAFDR